ncbi:porphobilinogen synthase [Algisphaera agarilytica]|uniref:Delta-aminolevulinic acid dehydratase n=1 Tax=Algisphaera agarilytica TaxID=1385975 RepID=A0A7X0H3Y6_9BACT|nr:porphobilinogen synthase [Algisphaera agarilytica]MBB6428764.1 porphobilinogen synthase [Algisphaera agarilytica]
MPQDLPQRPRRNRRTAAIRAMVAETRLDAGQLIYPLFLHDDPNDVALDSLPGLTRWSVDGLVGEVGRVIALGIDKVVLFPKIADGLKSVTGDEAYNPEGLYPRAIRAIKAAHPGVCVITDVALDPYSSDGHDGIVNDDGGIENDPTVEVLVKQALLHAEAGADIVAPSDMMDGRVGAIRDTLDAAGHADVSIMSYTAKYASAYYGPFRGALDSAPKSSAEGGKPIPGDKKTYQMDPANVREALREVELDENEGADFVMVKPAGPYLDVIRAVREHTHLPVAAYQVSGEYLMIKAAAASGWVDERAVVMESLLGIRRAGADAILTYFAPQVAGWLSEK